LRRVAKLEYFDRVFAELKQEPYRKSWSELKEKTKIPERTLARILERISKWGVARKGEDGKWVLTAYDQVYETFEEYEFALLHSQKLLTGIEDIIFTIKGGYMRSLESLVELCLEKGKRSIPGSVRLSFEEMKKHDIKFPDDEKRKICALVFQRIKTGYPDLHKLFLIRDALISSPPEYELAKILYNLFPDSIKYDGLICEKKPAGVKLSVRKPLSSKVVDYKERFVYSLIEELKNYLNFYPEAKTIPIEYKRGKLSIGSLKIRLDSKQAQEIINLIKGRNSDILKSIRIINNLKKELEEINEAIVSELLHLETMIKTGRPLRGTCDACRGIKIKGNKF